MIAGLYMGITPKLPSPPPVGKNIYANLIPAETDSGLFVLHGNWIRQNRYGLWEMYVKGDAFNRGVAAGKLSEKLVRFQEKVFIEQINNVVPSKALQRILLSAIAWMNRKMPDQIADEFKKEIYGISLSASEDYNQYGPPYARILNYHAAHDIGHALQSYYLLGCSSFAVWNERSTDSTLLIGRNFDFYFGDDFSRNKIIEFVTPDTGFNFAFITWGGMAGVVSGMNEHGLTVTINAGTLEIGRKAATPVTLVAREILQFAGTIDQAVSIASSRNINVSETFMIGSADRNEAILVEKKPSVQYLVEPDSSAIICTNHFQSKILYGEPENIENMTDNATGYRFQRMQELVNQKPVLSAADVASILRDKKGLHDIPIGYGNEKAINQFIAHHAVIFNPAKRIIWVSTAPNVMGAFMAYDLNEIFAMRDPPQKNQSIDRRVLEIPSDNFLNSSYYYDYLDYKNLSDSINLQMNSGKVIQDELINRMISDNPEYFKTYMQAGDYYFSQKNYEKAQNNYKLALTKEVNSLSTREYIQTQLSKCK
jgi:hypothetical protein